MLKKLKNQKLLIYEKYKGFKLTQEGRKIALQIIRKHRLWEYFLVEKLHFSWDEVHEVAEELEHIKSDQLIKRLDAFLDYPKMDPHGDPIPDEYGNVTNVEKVLLSNVKVQQQGIVVGVKDSSSEFLRYLDKLNISLGTSIKVLEKETFDNSLNVEID